MWVARAYERERTDGEREGRKKGGREGMKVGGRE